jgi:N-acetylglucosaminyl-diphospho-decaprenol L-rhamnosyltransferase
VNRLASPTLTVVVVTYNTRALALDCLASLEECAAGIAHETFVVDNASTDGTPGAVAAAFPGVDLIARSHNGGFSVANNEALRRARGRYTLLLNSDTRLRPGALEAMIDFLDAHPGTGMVGCRLVDGDGNVDASAGGLPGFRMQIASWLGIKRLVPRSAVRRALRSRLLRRLADSVVGGYFVPATSGSEPVEVDFLSGACVLVRGKVWAAVGLFDERFFLYLEDVDLCRRVASAGWRLDYLPAATVVHLGGRSFAARSGGGTHHLSRERAVSLVHYFCKHGGRGQALAMRALIVGAVAPRLALALVRGDRDRSALLSSIVRIAVARRPASTS